MDIDDILRSVSSGPDLAPETRDLQLLTRCWVAERSAPEVLPFPAELVERTMGRIRKQVCRYVPFVRPHIEPQPVTHKCPCAIGAEALRGSCYT